MHQKQYQICRAEYQLSSKILDMPFQEPNTPKLKIMLVSFLAGKFEVLRYYGITLMMMIVQELLPMSTCWLATALVEECGKG